MKIVIEIKDDKIDPKTIAKIKMLLHNAGYKKNFIRLERNSTDAE